MAKNIGFRPMFLSHDCIFPQHLIKTINKTDLSVELTNGSRIVFSGTEALDRLRGITADLLILDEYAFMSDEVLTVLEPIISARNGRIVVASTPKGYNHFFTLFEKEKQDKDYKSFRFTSYDNPHISKEEIDKAKQELDENQFAQEYMADFRKVEGLDYNLPDEQIIEPVNTNLKTETRIMGVDWGYRNPAAISVLYLRDNFE